MEEKEQEKKDAHDYMTAGDRVENRGMGKDEMDGNPICIM
jgi:hypothetical protein